MSVCLTLYLLHQKFELTFEQVDEETKIMKDESQTNGVDVLPTYGLGQIRTSFSNRQSWSCDQSVFS